jgi:hypothetical protein
MQGIFFLVKTKSSVSQSLDSVNPFNSVFIKIIQSYQAVYNYHHLSHTHLRTSALISWAYLPLHFI